MSAEKASKDVNKPESSIFPALQAISSLENVISLLDTESWSFPEKAEMKRKLQEFVEVIQNDSSNIMTGDSKEVSFFCCVLFVVQFTKFISSFTGISKQVCFTCPEEVSLSDCANRRIYVSNNQ